MDTIEDWRVWSISFSYKKTGSSVNVNEVIAQGITQNND